MRNEVGVVKPYLAEWQKAINTNAELQEEFSELQRNIRFNKQGVNAEEVAAL